MVMFDKHVIQNHIFSHESFSLNRTENILVFYICTKTIASWSICFRFVKLFTHDRKLFIISDTAIAESIQPQSASWPWVKRAICSFFFFFISQISVQPRSLAILTSLLEISCGVLHSLTHKSK